VRITTSRGQGQDREGLSEGSPSAKVRADEQKSHRRLSSGASQHTMTKPAVSRGRVNAAVVHRRLMFLFGEICPEWRCEFVVKSQSGLLAEQGPGAKECCRPWRANETTDTTGERSAPGSNFRRYWTEVSRGHISRSDPVKGRT
jgi:hypothetical protein